MSGFLLAEHEVRDFSEWRKGYLSGLADRAAAGLTEVKVFRDNANPNVVSMLFAIENLAKAKALVESPGLKAHMESIGVVGPMSARFLKESL
jgi:uncharacterized protein YeaO (DUF488 family)